MTKNPQHCNKLNRMNGQFLRFILVGITNTAVFFGSYLLFRKLFVYAGFTGPYRYLSSQALAFSTAILWAFFWNNRLVFTNQLSKQHWKLALLKTAIVYSFTGLLLNSFLLYLWVQIFGLSELIAPLLNSMLNIPINFILNKYWAFKPSNG